MPERPRANGTGQDVAGLVVNDHPGVDHLHVMVEAHSPTVVGGEAGQGAIVTGRQFADVKPIEANDRV